MSALAEAPRLSPLGGAGQPTIRTERLVLRPVRIGDAAAIAEALAEDAVVRMLPRIARPYHLEDAADWVSAWLDSGSEGWNFAVTRDGGELIGSITLMPQADRWELRFWLARAHWGEGLMSEALSAVLTDFFKRLLGGTVHAAVIADNPAALAVVDRLGFAVTGCRQTWCVPRNQTVDELTSELTFGAFSPI